MVKQLVESGNLPKWAAVALIAVLLPSTTYFLTRDRTLLDRRDDKCIEAVKENTSCIRENTAAVAKVNSRVDRLEENYKVTMEVVQRDIGRMTSDVSEIKKLLYQTVNDKAGRSRTYGVDK